MKIALAWVAGILFSTRLLAQDWPVRPVRIIVPFAPGGVADNSARVIAEPLGARLGQSVVVENRPGAGGTPHLAGELLKQRTGAQLEHVPYKGGGQAIADVVGGQIPLVFTAIATAQQYVRGGRLVALGVPSAKRSPALPEVPTFQESGLDGFDVTSWVGIFAPAKTPRPVVERLYKELAFVLGTPFVKERYGVLGIEPVGNSPREFFEQVREDLARWKPVVAAAKIK